MLIYDNINQHAHIACVFYVVKAGRAPQIIGIPEPDHATPKKFGTQGRILLTSRDGPVQDPGNESGLERSSYLSVGVFFMVHG